ncbi:MAG TPA: iron-sulfur cluster assembly scaffold protein [Pyrinomonadaceae bacterium]|nr:iron-sulfur cluster assembly scaffold protein [Pyrinomonadaceae bacterium]
MPVLYSALLLDHFRHPRNYGSLEDADVSYEAFNPLCGDRIRMELKLDGQVVRAARFKGDGCAISMAAASLLTELIVGKEMISDEELISALQSEIQPARIQCAILPLTALRDGLEHR